MPRSVFKIVLFCAIAAVMAGCAQTSDFVTDVQDNAFHKPIHFISGLGATNQAGNNFNLIPKGPVAASNLISPTGYCAPAPAPATPPKAAQKPAQAAAAAQASAPPPDRLQPEGLGAAPVAPQAQVFGGVSLGMSECAVARRLGSPSNVSISRSPKGQRRAVITYNAGERPGVYSFLSGRLIQIDATPRQASRYDRKVKKPRRARHTRDEMYVQ